MKTIKTTEGLKNATYAGNIKMNLEYISTYKTTEGKYYIYRFNDYYTEININFYDLLSVA